MHLPGHPSKQKVEAETSSRWQGKHITRQYLAFSNLLSDYNVSLLTTHANGGVYGGPNFPDVLNRLNFLNQSQIPLIFAQASYMSASHAELLRQTNHYISITPESEMHYGHDLLRTDRLYS
jgi:hypothetical protein